MCRLWNIAMRDYQESVTTGETYTQTDGRTGIFMSRYAPKATKQVILIINVYVSAKYLPHKIWLRHECNYVSVAAAFTSLRGVQFDQRMNQLKWIFFPDVCFKIIDNSNMTWFVSPIKSTDANSAFFPDINALAHWQLAKASRPNCSKPCEFLVFILSQKGY